MRHCDIVNEAREIMAEILDVQDEMEALDQIEEDWEEEEEDDGVLDLVEFLEESQRNYDLCLSWLGRRIFDS